MNKNDLKALRTQNGMRAVVWIVVLCVLAVWIWVRIKSDFKDVADPDSVTYYITCLWVALAATILVTVLWWISTTLCSGGVRNLVEEYSFLCALACIGIQSSKFEDFRHIDHPAFRLHYMRSLKRTFCVQGILSGLAHLTSSHAHARLDSKKSG